MTRILSPFILLVLLPAADGRAVELSAEFFFGGALNASTGLRIEQEGQETLDFRAEWETQAFDQPLYWAARIAMNGVFGESSGLELQLIHHKTYLGNMPPEVSQFEISHGFNILTCNYGYYALPVALRAGAGVVVAHTDAVVRGLTDETGYEITGPAFIAGAGRRIQLWKGLFASFDLQFSAARAKVTIPEGKAYTSNFSLHLMAGLGYSF
jgi:hypothetical protein